jgi:cyclopropane-fatty-acyl-phospholipid synthase
MTLLEQLELGQLHVTWPHGLHSVYGSATDHAPQAYLHIHHWDVCTQALKSGDIGFAESFIAGHWTTKNLVDLLRLLIANRKVLERVVYGHWWGRLAYRLRHWLNRNSKTNSRKNIHAHYDLGNAFYQLWLDDTMNYSSAWFASSTQDMRTAQHAKVRRALQMAGVQAGDRVLEIGCGWGALAEMATSEFKANMVGVTLSTEQLDYAQARMSRIGTETKPAVAADRPWADLRLQDYRDIGVTTPDQPFDAICSIEMLEAVGHDYWPTYFATVHRLLKPGGRACIQTITIDDEWFDRYLHSTDFIQQYIFPGGCLPSPSAFRAQAQAAGLVVMDELEFGTDYARTLAYWRERFLAQQSAVLALGFDDRFLRIWDFYLAYCEAAFAERNTSVMQFTLYKPT